MSAWTPDYEDAFARLTAAGQRVIQHGTLPGGLHFAYFDTELHPGTVFEISNLTAESFRPMLDAMQEAARTWDGSDPVRLI